MENVISKKQKTRARKSVRKISTVRRSARHRTLEEVLENCPFTRKKYEEAKATLARCPIPEEFLHRK